MKKILLATSALSMFAASAAFAEGPKVTLGGYIDAQIGIADQDGAFTDQAVNSDARLKDTRDEHIRTDSRIDVKVAGQADNGLGYGGVVTIIAEQNSSGADDGTGNASAEKTFIFVESGLGRIELGSNNGASQTMKVDASTFARGTGGIAGDFYKYVNVGASADSGTALSRTKYIVTPDLPSVALPGARANDYKVSTDDTTDPQVTEFANKITYYSPRVSGVQFGISYSPNLGERGNANGFRGDFSANSGTTPSANTAAQYHQDVVTAGLNYNGEYQGVGVKVSAVAEHGDSPERLSTSDANIYDDLKAYELGLNLSYAGFTVGGSWADVSEFGRISSRNDEAQFWTAGIGYEFGPFAASVTYLDSESEDNNTTDNTQDNEFTNLSIGADYKLAPGLVPYIEVSFFETDDNDNSTTDNDGSVVILGTQLTF